MITIKTPEEVGKMRVSGALLHQVLDALRKEVAPGVTTHHLDQMAERMIRDAGAVPSFKGFEGYKYTLCTSVDDHVVHGFPNKTPLKEGQLLSIDAGLVLDGWQADSAFSRWRSAKLTRIRNALSRLRKNASGWARAWRARAIAWATSVTQSRSTPKSTDMA